jgi:hypothetical protein
MLDPLAADCLGGCPLHMTHNLNLPPLQCHRAAWYGPDMARRESEWLYCLSAQEVRELEDAAGPWARLPDGLAKISADNFVLPTLGAKLRAVRHELISGRGFGLLRGLPVERYTEAESQAIFCGVGSHLGMARSQNAQGQLLGHVRDLGVSSQNPSVRVYQTNERQTFHTDSADVVGLLCLANAQSGGDSLLVSSSTLFNEMRQQCPDLLGLLLQPVATDRRGEVPAGQAPYFLIPVFSYYAQFLTAIYQRQYIDSAQRFSDAPRLTEQHVQALDRFDQLANSPELHFSMRLAPGDMQFVYNHALLHDRTAFQDWADPQRRRHLLRLWLAVPGDRPLPPCFASRYGSVEIGNRGGVSTG